LGTNDIGDAITAAQYKTYLTGIMDTINNHASTTDIILWSQFDVGTGDNYATDDTDYTTGLTIKGQLLLICAIQKTLLFLM